MKMRMKNVFFACNALCAVLLGGTQSSAQQASITLKNGDAQYCYTYDNKWSLTKTVTGNTIDAATGMGTINWTIGVTKSDGSSKFTVHGGLTVLNSGSAPATIGNIVVNLQKPNSPKLGSNASHVSIATNVADATNGDAATSAKIVATSSQENPATNVAWGTNNYVISGSQGTFSENACSGSLEFKDASDNTVFSLVPQLNIPVGGSITLLYDASFNVACLPALGTSLRVETIVSFGNAGQRGGSGASGSNIDINGNGSLSPDEAKVRSVPNRITLGALDAIEECNSEVMVDDLGATVKGTVTTTNSVGFDAFPTLVSESTSWDVSVDVDAGLDGGTVCNEAFLVGQACGGTLGVIMGYEAELDPATGLPIPIYATYECTAAAEASASACVEVDGKPDTGVVKDGDYCSFSQGGFGGKGFPFNLLAANFATLYPSGVEVGIPGSGGFSMKFSSATAVQNYLPAGGTAEKLNADSINPTSTVAGQFGGQVLALKLNIALSDADATNTGFGDLYYCPADTQDSLRGLTVRQILAAAETAIGGGALPSGYSYPSLAKLCANLDLSFDGKNEDFEHCGVASAWAIQSLSKVACP